jgi:hypothetical protein
MQEILDRDQIDGAFMLGRAIGHEAGTNRFGYPAKTSDYADIILAAGLTPAQRVVMIKAARTAQVSDWAI